MALDPNAGRGQPIVTYVRVGRGMVKVTKYENEQPKSPSETTSMRSSRSSSSRSASTPGHSRNWLRRPRMHKTSSKLPPSTQRSRSRSSARSLHTIRRAGGYMHSSEQDLPSAARRTSPPGRRGRPEPQGLFPPNNLSVPGPSRRGGHQSYEIGSRDDPRHHQSTPPSLTEWGPSRGRELRISPLSISPTTQAPDRSIPSPSTLSWTTDSEIDPAADSEMWSHITRLEEELVSRFGRGVVPPLSALRHEKSSAPPPDRAQPSLPDDLITALQRAPSPMQNATLKQKQRSHEPIGIIPPPPRQIHRAKSSPTLAFPLPPPNFPSWVTSTPLPPPPAQLQFPNKHDLRPSSPLLRAKAGPPPPFAPPPDFPPPPLPPMRPEDRDTRRNLEAVEAIYELLMAGYQSGAVGSVKTRPETGRTSGFRRPGESSGIRRDFGAGGRRQVESGGSRLYDGRGEDVLEEDEGEATPSGLVANAL